MSVLGELPPSSALMVIRLRSLGDCVLTTPGLHLLKQHRPDLRVSVVVEERFHSVFEGNPDVDTIVAPSVSAVRAVRPRLVVNLHGGTRSLVLSCLSGARSRAGFAHYRFASAYNLQMPRAQEVLGVDRVVHTAEHVASAMFWLGVPRSEVPRAQLFTHAEDHPSIPEPYSVIHPFAATPAKTWRTNGFLAAAEHLHKEHRLSPVFIGGPGDDFTPFLSYTCLRGATLRQTKALLQRASLFIGNDSGPAHMAAAFGVPVVVLFGPSDSVVWAPWQTDARVLQNPDDIQSIAAGDVIAACAALRVTQ